MNELLLEQELLSYRPPSLAYPLFLHEQYVLFLLHGLKDNRPYKFDILQYFLNTFFHSDWIDQHLLCEIYMHDIFLSLKLSLILLRMWDILN